MMVPLVNENDQVIVTKSRDDIDYSKDIFRTASLRITNNNGDILLAQRKFDKKVDPGKWAEAVGGTVESADSYEYTVIREAQKELGVTTASPRLRPRQFISEPVRYFV